MNAALRQTTSSIFEIQTYFCAAINSHLPVADFPQTLFWCTIGHLGSNIRSEFDDNVGFSLRRKITGPPHEQLKKGVRTPDKKIP